jgi:hypothetical protein
MHHSHSPTLDVFIIYFGLRIPSVSLACEFLRRRAPGLLTQQGYIQTSSLQALRKSMFDGRTGCSNFNRPFANLESTSAYIPKFVKRQEALAA